MDIFRITSCNLLFWRICYPIRKNEGERIKDLIIVLICAAFGSVLTVIALKALGAESSAAIGGGVGGAIAAFVCMKLYGKKQR